MWWDEVEAVGRLGALAAEEVADWAEQHQRVLAGRAFAMVGPVAAPVRAVHDVVLDVAYGGVRAVTRMAGQGLVCRRRARRRRSWLPLLAARR